MSEEISQMFGQLTSGHGRLKAVKPSGANRVTLEFENGTVDRPPLLTYGYRGTGVDNLRAFLREAGLDGDALAGIDDPSWAGVSLP
jgi:hypothetical protein